ncbi:MAG: DNA primase small subunit domain-containing protein [Carboxydocellales bacterium]
MSLSDKFIYVDAYANTVDGRNTPWDRIKLTQVPEYQQSKANFNVFATIQRFMNPERGDSEPQPHIAPLYFDLDFDKDPAVAQADGVKLVDFFLGELDIQPGDLRVYFSGSKGFHILVDEQALGISPRPDLTKAMKHVGRYLSNKLGDVLVDEKGQEKVVPLSSWDSVVYTIPRMLRLVNSVHQKTKLFKIELTIDELKSLSLDEIKAQAKHPRLEDLYPGYKPKKREGAAAFWQAKLEEYEQLARLAQQKFVNEEFTFKKGDYPACVADLLNKGLKKEGDRNQATLQLGCFFKEAGYTRDECLEVMVPWVKRITTAKGYDIQRRVANTKSVVDSVFEDASYKFGCAYIRALHGVKQPGSKNYERVACTGDKCPYVSGRPEKDKPISLHLSKTGDASFTNKLITTKVMVAGKLKTPFIVPHEIEYNCYNWEECTKSYCPLQATGGNIIKKLSEKDPELIEFCWGSKDNHKFTLKQLSGIPSTCKRYGTNVLETTNVEELQVIPLADDGDPESDGGEYVIKKVYFHGSQPIQENAYYEVEGYVYPHPKNSQATLLIKSARPLKDSVEAFQLTDEVKERLKVFRPAAWDLKTIAAKVAEICDDLTKHVTRIVNRDELLLASLLVDHSLLWLPVSWDDQPIRGWIECVTVGDTGTGKSHTTNKLLAFTSLGTMISAETASRTGITYKLEQIGADQSWMVIWGAWPLADRKMIVIDEGCELDRKEWGEMTMARSSGTLKINRAGNAETKCRVRMMVTTNVPKGKKLDEVGPYGCESLTQIFNNEDIRRFDMGIFLRQSDIDPEKFNILPDVPNKITSQALRDNILFAWSRKVEDVKLVAGTETRILDVATELSRIYGKADSVPLVSPSTQREKVARIAGALAALTNSTDTTGDKILIYPGHVDMAKTFLQQIYNDPACGLNHFARLAVKDVQLSVDEWEKVAAEIRRLNFLQTTSAFVNFVGVFATNNYTRKGELEAMLGLDRVQINDLIALLTRLRMIKNSTGGFSKTSVFNSFINIAFSKGIMDSY